MPKQSEVMQVAMIDRYPSRRTFVSWIGGTSALLAAPASAEAPAAARCYVDSRKGDDNRDGRTPATALRTLAAIGKLSERPRWIGLARESVFRGALTLGGNQTIEAYGEGRPPVIDASEVLEPGNWTRVSDDVWAYGKKLTWVEQLVFDGAPGGKKEQLGPSDTPRSWAWVKDTVHVRSPESPASLFKSILALNRTCIHILRADGAVVRGIATKFGVHGILGQHAENVTVADCSASRCAANGFYLADNTTRWTLERCIADRNGACGFAFNYGASHSSILHSRGTGNGIDGCQFSEGCGTDNMLADCEFSGNAIGGVNCKEKRQKVLRCRLEANGETGAVAQINTELLEISDTLFIRNNRSDNGTMNLALEDHARVESTRNVFIGPYGRNKPSANVRLIQRSELRSVADCFIDSEPGNNVLATIRVYSQDAARLTLLHASIYNRTVATGGRAIDCRDSPKASITITNTAIDADGPCITYDSRSTVIAEHNCYRNAVSRPVIEITGPAPRNIGRSAFRGSEDAKSGDRNFVTEALFADGAAQNLTLAQNSPARHAGKAGVAITDNFGVAFGPKPNIGAVAASGNIQQRVKR